MATSRTPTHDLTSDARHPRARFVEEFLASHGTRLFKSACRFSATAVDAEDAYQRALEILLTKAPPEYDEQQLLAWALTVIKNEAMMEHRRSRRIIQGSYEDHFETSVADVEPPDERVAEIERFRFGREALRRLKPDQARCLLLRADGLDYDEIGAITGFSYAKVNRCLSEGRRAFRDRMNWLESGAECGRFEGALSLLADGELDDGVLRAEVEMHLENCQFCKATLRDFRAAPSHVQILLPLAVVAAAPKQAGFGAQIGDRLEGLVAWVQQRIVGGVKGFQPGGEFAAAKKTAVVLVIASTTVVGGSVLETVSRGAVGRGFEPARIGAAASAGVNSNVPSQKSVGMPDKRSGDRGSSPRLADAADIYALALGMQRPVGIDVEDIGSSAADPDAFDPQPSQSETASGTSGASSDEELGLAP